MEIDKIRVIVELMDKHNLSEFKVEADDMRLCLKRELNVNTVVQQPAQTAPLAGIQASAAADITDTVPSKKEEEKKSRTTIDSPIVGTFYTASSPDAEAFVKTGDRVEPDTVVGIVEAMKVMNEIKAEKSGIIKEILIENAQSVEYGTPIFVLE
ncbi:MAG: acetyl-CoA carboxylase biotin carboxyl carrier protein [Victivallales bacterium]|nr:acetyl-CoA carboxylase biotin carboxyl carrier protein [Victivallales bacterium]MCF7889296.1 acetyl-CoA carboxylase biotin carboxyl carrier protein [Victivallales bacterium]